ncbi:oligogalacturonate lyase family protein, partial [Paenibacillus sepulcri]|nr:oligogalacturonate lyase family protein [Paenibacillus sepulcri]
MGKGKIWAPEWSFAKDRTTGVNICQLTNYMGHSYHLYFTEKGWYNEGRNLVFRSDRDNTSNLFSIDLQTGHILQLTDLGKGPSYLSACLHPQGSEVYFHHNHSLVALDLETLEQRILYEKPEGFNIGSFNCTADGGHLLLALGEDISSRVESDLKNGYVGFEEVMRARPLSRILRISLQTGEVETVFEDECFIGHINASPTASNLLTFCHEGPWNIVDHRIWGLDLDTGRKWKIRSRTQPMEMVGHEYWLAGGEYVGYHGMRESGVNFFGRIRPDNTGLEEVEFPFTTWHSYSSDFSRVVVDS